MCKIRCITNLDLFNEKWPEELPERPMIGDKIRSLTKHPQYERDRNGLLKAGSPIGYWSLEMEVYAIRWIPDSEIRSNMYKMEVELHIPKYRKGSIADFYKWYAPLVNKRVSSFI